MRADRAEIWSSCKSPIVASQSVAAAVGLPAERVTFHVIRGGGSFGHRLFWDPAIEAAQVSKAIGRPVKLMWTRNDDMRQGRMRPASHHKVRATHLLGNVLTFEHRMATLPVDFSHGLGEALTAAGFDLLSGNATGEPGGAGELGFPAAAAAVANAYARATGSTVRSFPIAG